MARFVILTLFFVSWAFFEVSGGADFDVPQDTAATLKTIESDISESEIVKLSAITLRSSDENTASILAGGEPNETDITERPRVVLASLPMRSLLSAPEPIRKPSLMDDLISAENARAPVLGEVSVGASVGLAETSALLSSVDIRKVRGNRVNMRNGPGKRYGVVATLSHGEKVEVIDKGKRGWVQLKVLDSGKTGWMAEFLLVEAN